MDEKQHIYQNGKSVDNIHLLEQILNDSNEMIQVSDVESFSMMYANDLAIKYTGHEDQPYKGAHCYEYMMGLKEQCPFCLMRQLGDGTSFETEVDNGKEIYAVKTKKLVWEGKEVFVEYAWDITNIRHSQRIYESQVQTLIAAIPDAQGIFHMDVTEDRVLTINGNSKEVNKMLGKTSVDELVRMVGSYVPQEKGQKEFFEYFNRESLIKAYSSGKAELHLETDSYFDDGSIREARITGRLIMNPKTNHLECIIYGMDISKEKRKEREAEAALRKALIEADRANKAKTAFLNNMSHDIRTPINGIIGMLSIIRKDEKDTERVKDCLDKMEKSSNLLLSLVKDVLDMAKLETDAVIVDNESVNLDQVCDEVTSSVSYQAEEAGIQVTGEHDDYTDIYVWSNALYLKKILMNLFTNSIKYNKPDGSIHVSMRTLERTEENITCEFKIKDTGIGMTEKFVRNKLFTPFVQADNSARSNYMGTGLGMPIVKQLVDKMGGTITVESKLGEGSCFTVVIPFKLDSDRKTEIVKDNPNADIAGLSLLLVEDNELNLEIAEFMLKDSGAKVVSVQNGLEAIQKFEASEPGTYDAILMDIMMPVIDGLTSTRKIRALDRPDAKTIPIIAMTANAFKEDAEKCLKAGMNAHLAKPLDMNQVKQTLCELVNK